MIKTAKRLVAIAQVGAYKKFSDADSCRHTHCAVWLLNNDKEFDKVKFTHDAVNLKYKRDFLKEDKHYDIVIVHSIFYVGDNDASRKQFRDKAMISENHTRDHWRIRLIGTGAAYIFICEGQPFSLSGWQLGAIDGYDIKYQDHMLTIYKKN